MLSAEAHHVMLVTELSVSMTLTMSNAFVLAGLATDAIQYVFDVNIACDKLCSLFRHGSQHPFPAFVDECHFIQVYDAPPPPNRATCPVPARFQLVHPRRNESALQGPLLYGCRIGDRYF